jgi:hypothetical protein
VLALGFGVAATACSDDGEGGPAISGENPTEVTVPTTPPTTTESTGTTLPAASDDTAPAETTLPAGGEAEG